MADDVGTPDAGTAASRTGRQAVWNYVVFALSKGSTLIMTVVLARLLTPADFGVFALALLVINLFDYVKDLGVGASLVQSARRWSVLAPSGTTLTTTIGVVAGGVVAITADHAAAFLGNAALTPMIRVLAVALVISALATVPQSRLRREIDFRRRVMPEFAGAVAKTGLSIGLAVGGLGVWSLVFGQLAAAVVTTAIYWWVAREPLRFGFDRAMAVELVRFGVPLTAVTLLAYGIYNIDYLSIGHRLGDEQLGLYTLAYRLPELLVLNLCVVVSDVLFSSLSRMQKDGAGLARHYLGAVGVVVALTAPLGALMAVAAPSVIHVLYGDGYAAAADDLAVLAVFTVVYSASFHSGDVYKAMGRPGILTAINAGKLAVMAYPVWWAAGHGTLAVALTLLAVEVVHFAVRMAVVTRIVDLPLTRLLLAIGRPALAAAVAAVAMGLVARYVPIRPGLLALLVLAVVGVLAYLPSIRFTAPELAAQATELVRRRLPTRSRADPAGAPRPATPPTPSTPPERTIVSPLTPPARRKGRVALIGALGLLLGLAGAFFLTSGPLTYRAHAVLAMLPAPSVSATEQAGVWEVLSRGQATRTGAIVLNQPQWLDQAAQQVGLAPEKLTMTAGAVPDTTLIDVTLDAPTPQVAERALTTVLARASDQAARVSGPFALDVIQPAAGTAEPLASSPVPTYLGLGLGGALIGVGVAFLLERALRTRPRRAADSAVEDPAAAAEVPANGVVRPLVSPPVTVTSVLGPARAPVAPVGPNGEPSRPMPPVSLFAAPDVHSPTVPVTAVRPNGTAPRPAAERPSDEHSVEVAAEEPIATPRADEPTEDVAEDRAGEPAEEQVARRSSKMKRRRRTPERTG
jgi:PST family polysaccharide transporter